MEGLISEDLDKKEEVLQEVQKKSKLKKKLKLMMIIF